MSPYFLHSRLFRCRILSRSRLTSASSADSSHAAPALDLGGGVLRPAEAHLAQDVVLLLCPPAHGIHLPPRLKPRRAPVSRPPETQNTPATSENAARLNVSTETAPKAPARTCARVRPPARESPLCLVPVKTLRHEEGTPTLTSRQGRLDPCLSMARPLETASPPAARPPPARAGPPSPRCRCRRSTPASRRSASAG